MGLLEEYETYFNTYKTLYGTHIAVLYQNGKFHEVYGIDNAKEKVGNVSEISDIIGIKETRRDSKILDNNRSNHQMAGFNSVSLDENVEKLVNYGYTVIVINQIPDSKPVKREVAYVKSPSTNVNTKSQKDPYLVSIYVSSSYNKSTKRAYQYIGMSAIDVTTGNSYIFESNSTPSDPSLASDELIRFLQTFNPVEVILNQNIGIHDSCRLDNNMIKLWGYKSKDNDDSTYQITDMKPTVYMDTNDSDNIYKLQFQEDFLSRIFDANRGAISAIEYLELEKYIAARISYIYMLQFCISHNKELLNSIDKPSYWQSGHNLILDTSSILQLNVIENYYNQQRQASVYDMLFRYVQTPMGRRTLKDRLLNPIVDPSILEGRYNSIDTMYNIIEYTPPTVELIQKSTVTVTITLYDFIKDSLTGIRDIDRLHRKLALNILTPAELHTLDCCYEKIIQLFTKLGQYDLYPELVFGKDKLIEFRKRYNDVINITDAGCCTVTENIQDSIFKVGYNSDIDTLSAEIRKDQKIIQVLCQKLSDLVAKGSSHCKYKEDLIGDGSCYCSLTKPQYKKLQDGLKSLNVLEIIVDNEKYTISQKDLQVDDRNKTNVKIRIELFNDLYEKIQENISKLRTLSIQLYKKLLVQLTSDLNMLNTVSKSVGEIDLYRSLAYHAEKYKYCKPIIEGNSESRLRAHGLRHPIIERNNVYVAQDITLDKEHTGILLYGVNQSGKSCTMKSVGIAIIMAQAGMYVAADSFSYYPYTTLMTRILGNDNADKGLSTFAVEMMELRSILTRNNNRTLVLGDELCHGTESASAVSLVAASIMHLSESNTSFIFATHLHELSNMEEITTLNNVDQYHLTISFDQNDGETIIYNRIMKKGSGTGLYGVEVAKHLKIPQKVVDKAYSIRNKYYNKTESSTKSTYNSDVVVSKCKIPQCNNNASETHHIMFQSESDKNGLIGAVHKNNAKNLIPLCEKHHDMVHHGVDGKELVIFGYGVDGRVVCEMRKMLQSFNCTQVICPRYIKHME